MDVCMRQVRSSPAMEYFVEPKASRAGRMGPHRPCQVGGGGAGGSGISGCMPGPGTAAEIGRQYTGCQAQPAGYHLPEPHPRHAAPRHATAGRKPALPSTQGGCPSPRKRLHACGPDPSQAQRAGPPMQASGMADRAARMPDIRDEPARDDYRTVTAPLNTRRSAGHAR